MKQGLVFSIIVMGMVCASALAAGGTLPGAGTEASPYLIEDVNDFDAFANPANAATYWAAGVHTKLTTDIDLSGRTYTTAVIAPDTSTSSGFQGTAFAGVFNGNSYTIINLTIDTIGVGNHFLALFGKVEGVTAEIKNLGIENITITGGSTSRYAGSLVGINVLGYVKNCHSHGLISVDGIVGGLVGASSGSVENSYSTGTVTGAFDIGGLVGWNHSGSITNSYSTCNVIGDPLIPVVAPWNFGGLVAENYGNVTNCFAAGDVSGIIFTGGLIGESIGDVTNCYSISKVEGSSSVGGFMGQYDSGGLINNFWDVNTSGTSDGVGNEDPDPIGVDGKTTSEMQTQSTFTGWNFITPPIWMMLRPGEDYPRLAWQEIFAGDIAGLYGADLVDFAYLANYWQLSGCNSGTDCGRADIDGSGTVDLPDLAVVAQDWLQ